MRHTSTHKQAAVLATALLVHLLAGCDAPGAGLLDPETVPASSAKGKGPKPAPASFTVAAEGALVAAQQPMTLVEETDDRLALEALNTYRVEFAFAATRSAAEAWLDGGRIDGACRIDGGRNTTVSDKRIRRALDKLVSPDQPPPLRFHVVAGKGALIGEPAPQHSLGAVLQDGEFDIRLGGTAVAPATAVAISGGFDAAYVMLEYTGGEVFVKDRLERPHFYVICWNRDAARVTITRSL